MTRTKSLVPRCALLVGYAIAAVSAVGKEAAVTLDVPPLSVTSHEVTVNGKLLHYHAVAGYLVLQHEREQSKQAPEETAPKAKIFFVAYTRDDVKDPATRPLTFVLNGGPGSSTLWLHMSGIGPRRPNLGDEGDGPAPPYRVVDSDSTWLDSTDLVFIDPVSSGFSRPAPGVDPKQFYNYDGDIQSLANFMHQYVTRYHRWLSPKYIVGESYGTTRAAGLTGYLNFELNGIILISTLLDYQQTTFAPQNQDPYIAYLPTYATTAWYHHRLAPDLQSRSVADVATEAREFAGGAYAVALRRGNTLPEEERRRVVAELSRLTGLPEELFVARGLRVPEGLFRARVLHDDARFIGRYDARFVGTNPNPGSITYTADPTNDSIWKPTTSTFNAYVSGELGFVTDLQYVTGRGDLHWDFGKAEDGFTNAAETLRLTLLRNPYLKVWVLCGYYDLATPFFGAETTFAEMDMPPDRRANIRFTYYEAGHSPYIRKAARVKLKSDYETFLQDSLSQPLVRTSQP